MANNISISTIMGDAIRRNNVCLINTLKRIKIQSHLYFLKECKRRGLVSHGFLVVNKLANSYPCAAANRLTYTQAKQWMTLTISQLYRRLCTSAYHNGPLTENDTQQAQQAIASLAKRKQNKLQTLLRSKPASNVQNNPHNRLQTTAFINMSARTFTEDQLDVLQRGPSYVPPISKKGRQRAQSVVSASFDSLRRHAIFFLLPLESVRH